MRGLAALALLPALVAAAPHGSYDDQPGRGGKDGDKCPNKKFKVSFGSRPFYLLNNMTESPLKSKLQSCENDRWSVSGFTIAHRGGATLQFPEHSKENNMAGFKMGTGVVECDVAFTKDRKLVCRHSLCDLHTTTDILLRPELAAKCTQRFKPANGTAAASALCCTSDITVAEYKTLCAKVDGSNASATTAQAYQRGGPTWRTDLYNTCGTPLTLEEHIDLVEAQPSFRNFTPELKTPPSQVPMPFQGTYTQQQYARDMLDTFIRKGIDPSRVWAQSFLPDDIFQWIKEYPVFARQAVYLDEDGDTPETLVTAAARLPELRAKGVNFIAPPLPYLLTVDNATGKIVPSNYAKAAKAADLDIISWTFERSGPAKDVFKNDEYYFQNFARAISYDGQIYEVLDVLVQKVGIVGLFTDWAETVTYYANCLKVPGPALASAKRLAAGKYKGLGA